MNCLLVGLKLGRVSRESIISTLTAYNNSCAEMKSEARDKYISKLNGGMGVRLGLFGHNAS